MEANGGEFLCGVGEIARQIVEADGRDRAGRGKLAAKLVEIGFLAANADRDGDWHGQQAGILGAEEGVEEAGPGVGRDQNAFAAHKPGPDQFAGDDMGAFANLAPRQGRELLTLGIIKGHPGLALRRVIEHRWRRRKAGAMQGERGIAGRQQFHRKAGLLAERSEALKERPAGRSAKVDTPRGGLDSARPSLKTRRFHPGNVGSAGVF